MEITYDQRKMLIKALEISLTNTDIARPSTIVVWEPEELEKALDADEVLIRDALRILD